MWSSDNIPNAYVKGQPYRIYFRIANSATPYNRTGEAGISSWVRKISKDGGAWADLTNTPVEMDNQGSIPLRGWYYIDLTADEMNADIVCICVQESDRGTAWHSVVMEAKSESSSSSGMSLTDSVADISEAPEQDPTVRDVLSFLYQYFRKRRKRTKWSINRHIYRG